MMKKTLLILGMSILFAGTVGGTAFAGQWKMVATRLTSGNRLMEMVTE